MKSKILFAVVRAVALMGSASAGLWPFESDDEYIVPPVVVAKDWSGGAIFPFVFADFKGSDTFWTVFPVIYSHEWGYGDSTFWMVFGLYGEKIRSADMESYWLAPLWWRRPKDRSAVLAAGLIGWDHGDDGNLVDWFFPFYYSRGDDFYSIPYGHVVQDGGITNRWWGLPLFRTWEGARSGYSVLPLVEYDRDAGLDAFEQAIGASCLTDDLLAKLPWKTLRGDASSESVDWLLGLAGMKRSICLNGAQSGVGEGGRHNAFCESRVCGNRYLFSHRESRIVRFNRQTGWREEVSESTSTSLLGFVWNSECRRRNGRVVSSKSSLLCGLFRSESIDGHFSLDLFFLPVWR